VGDINGVGLEVIMNTFSDKRIFDLCTPVIYASSDYVSDYQKQIGFKSFSFNLVKPHAKIDFNRANLVSCWTENLNLELGVESPEGGVFALKSLRAAVEGLKKGEVDALVTAPINKHNIQSADFNFPGHTEYLASQFTGGEALMFMISGSLRVGLVTGHISISEVALAITEEKITSKLSQMHDSLQKDFNIRKPRIAVLGLNPHSGDQGVIGKEDKEVIMPAVQKSFESGKLIYGPYPADSFFVSDACKQFDAVLAMYHDQGLIPFKTMSFNNGVNFTAGLSVIRTSPDHGTAYDIVGKNLANPSSFRTAVYQACTLFKNRKEYLLLNDNSLKFKSRSTKKWSY
jgi:4-hydroxythreonine-4-phosphate dehydrogenase